MDLFLSKDKKIRRRKIRRGKSKIEIIMINVRGVKIKKDEKGNKYHSALILWLLM